MDPKVLITSAVPSIIALVVVIVWALATATGAPGAAELHDPAFVILAFYFGAIVHSAGVTAGAAQANGTTT